MHCEGDGLRGLQRTVVRRDIGHLWAFHDGLRVNRWTRQKKGASEQHPRGEVCFLQHKGFISCVMGGCLRLRTTIRRRRDNRETECGTQKIGRRPERLTTTGKSSGMLPEIHRTVCFNLAQCLETSQLRGTQFLWIFMG